jgi:probable HAF family extracellular repeat protein
MQDLGTLDGVPGFPSGASAVNVTGQVVGWTASSSALGNNRAFLSRGGTMYDLGTITSVGGPYTPSQANGINTSGKVVGSAGYDPTLSNSRAWIWIPTQPNGTSGQITDLNSLIPAGSGWVLTSANGINDGGQIAGVGLINGQLHAFLLTPQ